MWVQPCCIDNELPKLLREAKGGFCFFQTNGDCTLSKVLNAVSSMVGNDGHVMVLTVGEVDVMMLRTLEQYLRREWSKAVLLLTAKSQEALVRSELGGYLKRVHYAVDPMVVDGQIALIGCRKGDTGGEVLATLRSQAAEPSARSAIGDSTEGSVPTVSLIIQGAMLGQVDFSLSLYAAWLGKDKEVVKSAINPIVAKLKTKAVIDHHEQPDIARILNREW